MPSAQVRVLGPVEVIGPAGKATLTGAKQRAVLGLLALKAGTVVPQWRLVDALWGDPPPRTAIKSMQSHVARVRQALAVCGLPDVLATKESGYVLSLPCDTVDAWRFEQCVRQARDALADDAVERAAAHLRDGLALWQDDTALADAEVTGWGEAEMHRLSEVRLTAIEDWWDTQLQLGHHESAMDELGRLLVTHPLRERLVGLHMLALYRCGRHNNALHAYQRLRARLADELGVDPGPELTRLHTMILRRDPEPDTSPTPGHDSRPAAPSPATPRPAQLPARVGYFTGRARELAELDRMLDRLLGESTPGRPRGDVQVAVISGPAGIGKTALAVQWAHRMADRFRDGQLFVDLRGHERDGALSPTDALSSMLRSLGVPADRIPADPTEQAGLYRSLLHSRRVLIVADNGGTAEDILPLVPAGSANMLLVTSRNSLTALATHHAVGMVSLDVLSDADALDLLGKLLGAQVVEREPAAAAELVRLCDRMPLAVRIAAAKIPGGTGPADRPLAGLVHELAGAGRLDALTVDGGSRSVAAVFASAYGALDPAAARLFRLLGLHPGQTVPLHVAAAMADLPVPSARKVIAVLANAHLLTEAGPDRLRLHDLVALFAHRRALADHPAPARAEAIARMLDWYLAVAAAANRIVDPGRDRVTPKLRFAPPDLPFTTEPQAALAFLEGERANLLSVARNALGHGRPDVTWQLTYLLTGFYDSCGHWHERVELCHLGVAAARSTGDPVTEGLMLSALGVAYIATRRFDEALHSLREALPLMRAGGDMRGAGHVHNNIAAAYSGLRRFPEAISAFREALEVHTANGHRLGIALALNNTGHTYVRMGKPELSTGDLMRALEISRDLANRRLEAAALHSLGEAGLRGGSTGEALRWFREALAVYQQMGDRQYQAETLHGLGLTYSARSEHACATGHLERALGLARDIADQHLEAVIRRSLGRVHLDAADLRTARAQFGMALAARAWVPDAYEEANVHRDLGDLEALAGDPEGARQQWELAMRLYQKVNAVDDAEELAARLA